MLLILVKIIFFKIFEVEILAPGGFVVYKEGVWGIRFPTPRGRWSGNKNSVSLRFY